MSRDERARSLVEDGALLLDVRTPAEFAAGHLPGAVNTPLAQLEGALPSLDRSRPIVLYCRSGARSRTALRLLHRHSFTSVHDMGAMSRWEGGLDLQRYAMPLLASLTLGLAPFTPEPHLVGKLRWIAGGGVGMGWIDYGDLLMHGAPWIWLLLTVLSDLRGR